MQWTSKHVASSLAALAFAATSQLAHAQDEAKQGEPAPQTEPQPSEPAQPMEPAPADDAAKPESMGKGEGEAESKDQAGSKDKGKAESKGKGEGEAEGKKANVVILATGGTIAGAAPSGAQAGYTSGQVNIDAMLKAVPNIKELANVRGEQIANVGSQDMSFDIILKLANRINALLAKPDVDGVVVTHGTDTMEETAYLLNLVVKSDKPVVMVGSMRPSTAISADGPLNLYNAVAVASDPEAKGRGVLVVMNDAIHAAHSVTKTNTTAVDTFESPVGGQAGVVNVGEPEFFNDPQWKHTTESEFDIKGVKKLPRVDIVYGDVDMKPDLIDASVKAGAKGIVIAGMGNGNLNEASVKAAENAAKKGVIVVRSTRVPTGSVGRNVELDDDKLGFIASDELNPQKSRVLLTLALLEPRDPQEIQELFYTY